VIFGPSWPAEERDGGARLAGSGPFPLPARGALRAVAGASRGPAATLALVLARVAGVAKKIAVLSQKGGTGKTTAVRTLTDIFRRIDLDVLAIDLDPQGNLSDYFDVDPDATPTVGDVLSGRAKAASAVHDGIIPANLALAEAELAMAGKMGRELILRKALADVDAEHDVILIDCPPALGLLTVNALVAADWALLSAEAQYFALQGVEQALEVIELARDGLNPDLQWLGVVFNIADMRTVHSREAFDSLREHVGDKLLDTVVRQSIAYAESAERAISILDHRPDLGSDYVQLADEVLGRLGLADERRRLKTQFNGAG
jgi:chromosome partitioning protein